MLWRTRRSAVGASWSSRPRRVSARRACSARRRAALTRPGSRVFARARAISRRTSPTAWFDSCSSRSWQARPRPGATSCSTGPRRSRGASSRRASPVRCRWEATTRPSRCFTASTGSSTTSPRRARSRCSWTTFIGRMRSRSASSPISGHDSMACRWRSSPPPGPGRATSTPSRASPRHPRRRSSGRGR